jgi:2-polyprenyl-6-methoxyphenol hydroxylase-like FAD-dependent oxidoreductase
MARIVMIGGGVVGLCAALLLGRDGHEVTVLERDPAAPPDPDRAWSDWERRGVNQFRMLHLFQPRFQRVMEANAPEVVSALADAGALLLNPFRTAPAQFTGGFTEADARFDGYTARRPVAEAAIAGVVGATDGVRVRRGVAVTGLLTAEPIAGRPPHVVGVRTDAGEELRADLVVDASGRRSALPELLVAIGANPPVEEKADCGFIYYGRHFRSSDGSIPPAFGPLLMDHGTVSILTLPADNGTWGIGLITSAKDHALRGLHQNETWTRAVASFPLIAHWLDGEPVDDVAVMAKIEDRHRSFVVDGDPVATGVLSLADSWACTNPSVGRGISIGAVHAAALRDVLHDPPDDPLELAVCWHNATMRAVEPWYRATLAYDNQRLAQIEAARESRPFEADPEYDLTRSMMSASMKDPEVLRAFVAVASVLELPSEVLADPGVLDKVRRLGGGWREEDELPGPNREQLCAIASGDPS